MNPLHLLWICPACAGFGVFLICCLVVGRSGDDD